jgi:hypothetical protein
VASYLLYPSVCDLQKDSREPILSMLLKTMKLVVKKYLKNGPQ